MFRQCILRDAQTDYQFRPSGYDSGKKETF